MKVFHNRQSFVNFINPMQTKSGRIIWMSTDGAPILDENGQLRGYRGTDRDVTEQIRLQESLERQNSFLDSVIDAVQSAVLVLNASGDIVFSNPAARRILALNVREGDLYTYNDDRWGIQTENGDPMPEEDLPFNVVRRTKRPIRGLRMAIQIDGGDRRLIEVSGNPVLDRDGEIQSVVFSVADVTQQEEAARELMAARRRAESANRTKSQFLANMSHELRTPLNGIMGMADLLMMANLPDEQREQVEVINRSAVSLLHLINEILDLARIEEGRLAVSTESFNPATLLSDFKRHFSEQAARKGIALRMRTAADLPLRVVSSEFIIRRIFENLLENAVKFTESGSIDVVISQIRKETGETALQLIVEDTGVGFPSEKCEEIFERFYQVDNSPTRRHGGAGLGLSIVKELTARLGGTILAESPIHESREQPGARFCVEIPCSQVPTRRQPEQEPAMPTSRTPEIPPAAMRVLIVEDNPINRSVTESFLKHIKFATDTATNGREAVEKLASQPFDIVLMDISMPVMDGFEALQIIRSPDFHEYGRTVPVIAVTAHAMAGDRESFLSAGFTDYLSKPYKFEQLKEKIHSVLKANP